MNKLIFLFVLLFLNSCEKWNLDKEDFLDVSTGTVMLTDVKSASVKSKITGIVNDVVIQHGHIWSSSTDDPTLAFNEGIINQGGKDSDGDFTSAISNLEVNTTYNIRAFAETSESITYGNIQSFTTGNITVATGDLQYTTAREATITGSFCCLGFGITVDQHGFCWSSNNTLPTIDTDPFINIGIPESDGSFSGTIENLEDKTLYYYRSYLVTNFGTEIIYGEVRTWESNLENIWNPRADIPIDFALFLPAFSHDGKGYVYANNTLWKYDPENDSWTEGPSKPGPLLLTKSYFVIDDHVYFMIGSSDAEEMPGNKCWRYNLINNIWEDLNDFPGLPRLSAVGFSTGNGKGYAGIGTILSNDYSYQDFWEYDPISDEWTEVSSYPGMTVGLNMLSFVVNDKAYVGGGGGAGLDNFYSYDPGLDEWTLKGSLPGGQTFETTSFTIGNLGYMGTGESLGNFFSKSVWSYEPVLDEWNEIADFGGGGRFGAFSFSINEKGYVGGGVGVNLVSDFWEYKSKQD
ncbi:MAG: Kelch repeat-containing protein [Saprospiraceae bacterium]